MCILFVYVNPNPEPGGYKIVLASNRDELFNRPAKPAHEWLTHSGVFGGQDMQPGKEGGTWLAMNKHGRIGVLLNVGQSAGEIAAVDPSSGRGFYALEWLTNMEKDMQEVFNIVKEKHGDRKQPFRLVMFDTNGEPQVGTLTYAGGKFDGFSEEFLPPGVHALGNNAPGIVWNKVLNGKKHFESIIQDSTSWGGRTELRNKLIDLLSNKEKHWPDMGISEQMKSSDLVMESLSAIFVDIPKYYGTRTHTVILINAEDQAMFYEKTMEGVADDEPIAWIENVHEFALETKM